MSDGGGISHFVYDEASSDIVAANDQADRSWVEHARPKIGDVNFKEIITRANSRHLCFVGTSYFNVKIVHMMVGARSASATTEHDLSG